MNSLVHETDSQTACLSTLCHLTPQLLPCDDALLLDLTQSSFLQAYSDETARMDVAALLVAMEDSSSRLSAENNVQAAVFRSPFHGFRSWVSRPLKFQEGDDILLVCFNRSDQPFPSSALTRLAILDAMPPRSDVQRVLPRPLSGIFSLNRCLDTQISSTSVTDATPVALLRIDLGRIGPINDLDGWPASDALIERAYLLLQDVVPPECFTVHLGGGSFAVVVPIERDIADVQRIADNIVRTMQKTTSLAHGEFPIEPYIGWACYPFDAPDTDTLIGFANAALSRIRGIRSGPRINRVAPEIAHAHSEMLGMESDLRQAIVEGTFNIHWLPVLETRTEHVIAFEALVRWHRPGYGDIDPSIFLHCAENAGLIEDIDSWVLHTACRRAQEWKEPLGLGINVSPSWLETERVATAIGSALKESGLDPARLQIELSEQCSFGSPEIVRKELARIRAMGVRLVLDDFGTGFGSLERLTNYPFDQVKLDRTFIRRVGMDSRVETILRSTLHMIHALDMTCCAEGVETEEQLGFLDAHGCEEIQGYLIGQPTLRVPE